DLGAALGGDQLVGGGARAARDDQALRLGLRRRVHVLGMDRRAGGLRLRRAIVLGVGADRAGEPPQLRVGVLILGAEEEREQVGAERARQIAELVLDDL